MAARYNLEARYPEKPEIWDARGSTTASDRDEKSDQYSRPRFANFLGADAIISIHTNAATSTTARGFRAFAYNGRTQDVALGNSIICYAKEIVQAQEAYKTYVFDSYARQSGLVENGEAQMSAILLETGFHTNPTDAAALADPVFQEAAMKGIEKGYRLHREGKPCQPFKTLSIANASGNHGTKVTVLVKTQGFPQGTVLGDVEITSCPPGTCNGSKGVAMNVVDGGFSWTFGCNSSKNTPTRVIGVRTTLYDADGVKTTPVDSTVTCTKPSTSSSSSSSANGDAPAAASFSDVM
ncbi:N-acetylmuramoyl-L-alanine amidase [Xanthomonas phaseoli pv. phaseoli]|nr:N-acetylmuramoyl-L-alanine amidase [Xanthomonas phaseoli pv. phaseoli]